MYTTLQPGVYGTSTALNNLTKSTCHGGNAIVHMLPGIYYFNFPLFTTFPVPSIGVWAITAGTVIAGNLRPGVTLTPGVQPPLPGACKSPVPTGAGWVAPEPGDGVTIVMGGTSQMLVTQAARVEICGQYAPNTWPPVAITAMPTTGTLGTVCALTGFPCAALTTGQVVTGAPLAMYVQGTTMLPNREFVMALRSHLAAAVSRRSDRPPCWFLLDPNRRRPPRHRGFAEQPRAPAGRLCTSTFSSVRARRPVPPAAISSCRPRWPSLIQPVSQSPARDRCRC